MNKYGSLYLSSMSIRQHVEQKRRTPDHPYRVTYFETALLGSVLENALNEMQIFLACSNEWRVAQAQANLSKLRAIKYEVEQPKVTDELADVNPRNLGCEEYKLRKLFADRHFFNEVLQSTYKRLCVNKDYTVLVDHVKKITDTTAYRERLIKDEMSNRLLRREINRQFRQQRNHIKSATYEADCAIAQLKMNVEDAALNAMVCSRYVTNWQGARSEQNHQVIRDKESLKENKIELFKQKYDQEQRVHAEIEMLATIHTNETLQKVEAWMNKYDTDMEAVDLKIQIMKNNHVVQKEKREELEQTIEEHDRLMKNWIKFKQDREDARLYREKMNNAAIVVQAWWRGLLVRNQLGPYKPQPKKKGGDKKDKKKK